MACFSLGKRGGVRLVSAARREVIGLEFLSWIVLNKRVTERHRGQNGGALNAFTASLLPPGGKRQKIAVVLATVSPFGLQMLTILAR